MHKPFANLEAVCTHCTLLLGLALSAWFQPHLPLEGGSLLRWRSDLDILHDRPKFRGVGLLNETGV